MQYWLQYIPLDFWLFLLITLFSLLIGIEQRRLHLGKENKQFGSDRTFTFIGILGFMLYQLDKVQLIPYLGGGLVLAILLAVYYYHKIYLKQDFGLTTLIVALITYALPAFTYTQPLWLVILTIVSVLILAESKPFLKGLADKLNEEEFFTLGKFLVIAGVVLPIAPDTPITELANITPYRIWLAVVVISGISYSSYLSQKFIFTQSGTLLFGILGGIYSSTATTILLSRKSNDELKGDTLLPTAILFATATMYLRILVIAYIFNANLAVSLTPFLLILSLLTWLTGWSFLGFKNLFNIQSTHLLNHTNNPLELNLSFIFAIVYIAITLLTHFTLENFGLLGIDLLSILIGLTNIDAFLLSIFQGKLSLNDQLLAIAVMQAIIGNNLFKALLCEIIADKSVSKQVWRGFAVVIVGNIALWFVLRFII
jgi:uncharacterized membrane protein (DUF4010 family)